MSNKIIYRLELAIEKIDQVFEVYDILPTHKCGGF